MNNAGFLRDRMVVSTSEDEWDAVIRVHLKGHFAPTACAGAFWREQQKAGRRGRRPGDQHVVGRRAHGQRRSGRVQRGQGRHRRAHDGGVGRARPVRRDRQRDRTGGPHAHDRGGVRRHDGRAGRRRVRRDGARRTSRRSWCGSVRPTPPGSPGACSRSRAGSSRSPTAGSTARARTRARAGSRPRSVRWCGGCSPRRPDPAPVYGA